MPQQEKLKIQMPERNCPAQLEKRSTRCMRRIFQACRYLRRTAWRRACDLPPQCRLPCSMRFWRSGRLFFCRSGRPGGKIWSLSTGITNRDRIAACAWCRFRIIASRIRILTVKKYMMATTFRRTWRLFPMRRSICTRIVRTRSSRSARMISTAWESVCQRTCMPANCRSLPAI